MTKIKDCIWLWGQTPGSHHATEAYHLPGVNHMTPLEGCEFFGIRNMCRVAMTKGPFPPFDGEAESMKHLDRVVWSVIGAGGVHRNEEEYGDLEEIIRQAVKYPNIVGGVMDDFLLSEERRKNFTPEKLGRIKEILEKGAGRKLEFWTVYYDRELELPVQEYLQVFDVITFWNWYGENLFRLRENLDRIMAGTPGKKFMAGCYMWDYGNGKPLTPEQMNQQLEIYREYMRQGRLAGVILCSNCIADLGIQAVEQTRQWIAEHGNEEI